MGGITLLPTKTCFDDALDEFQRLVKEDRERGWNGDYSLVHGVCVTDDGDPYSHAWLETKGGDCISFGIMGSGPDKGERVRFTCDRVEFHKKYRVQQFSVYSWHQAVSFNLFCNTYGPWEPQYLALTRQGKEGSKHGKA